MSGAKARRAAQILLAVGGAALGIALAEGGLRIFWNRTPLDWWLIQGFVPDPELFFVPLPFRQDGFLKIDPSLPTVVTLGDSFTAGFPVSSEESYPAVLREILVQRGRPTNVVNLGVGASGPDQQLRILRHYLPAVHPDVVVWQFYQNDLWNGFLHPLFTIEQGRLVALDPTRNFAYRCRILFDGFPLPRSVKERSYLLRLTFEVVGHWGRLAEVPEDVRADPEAWVLEKIRLEIREMKTLAAERGFRLYILLVAPQASWLAADATRSADAQDWRSSDEFLRDRQLRGLLAATGAFIDAGPATMERSEAPTSMFANGAKDPAALGRRHLNELGYRRVAEIIDARLQGDGLP